MPVLKVYDGSTWQQVAGSITGAAGGSLTGTYPNPTIASGVLMQNWYGDINGLITSYTSGSAAGTSGSLNVGKGRAADTSGVYMMQIASGLTKTLASGTTWKSGTSNAGLDAVYPVASLQSGWLHVHAIGDGNITDVIICNNVSGVNPVSLPSGMTYNRRIASIKTDASGNVVPYIQTGDTFLWANHKNDYVGVTLASGITTLNVSVPKGITTTTILNAGFSNPAAGQSLFLISLMQDAIVSAGGAPTAYNEVAGQFGVVGSLQIVAVSGSIRAKTVAASGSLYLTTEGWIDTRGKDGA